MPSQIEARYGVPLPIDVLWSLLSDRLGPDATNELRALYRQAVRRYARASELNRRRRLVKMWESKGQRGALCERYRRSLANPQAYIGEEEI